MSILVADSGSTKTDWRLLLPNKQIVQLESVGLNPNFIDDAEIKTVLQSTFNQEQSDMVLRVYFYGAGCGNKQNIARLGKILQEVFFNSTVEVASDMLGAARALCGHNQGMAAILGTGMNTCFYDGSQISIQPISLGYILGDEGSGAYLGKVLIRAFLRNELPETIRLNFEKRFQLDPSQIISAIYREPLPNKFLAKFAKFIYQNLKQEYAQELVINAFRFFFKEHITRYPNYKQHPLHLTGSVAFYFSNLLRRVASDEGIIIGSIIEKPIAAIAIYHFDE